MNHSPLDQRKSWCFRFVLQGFMVGALLLVLLVTVRAQSNTPMNWSTPTTGTIGGTNVSISGFDTIGANSTLIAPRPFNSSDYSAAPIASAQAVQYGASDNWTATFSAPTSSLLLYAIDWRGSFTGNPDPASTYTFDHPFVVLSGFSGAIILGNSITLPDGNFFNGILGFAGTMNSLSVISNAPGPSGQGLTFSIRAVPETLSSAWALFGCFVGLIFLRRLLARTPVAALRSA